MQLVAYAVAVERSLVVWQITKSGGVALHDHLAPRALFSTKKKQETIMHSTTTVVYEFDGSAADWDPPKF